MTISCTASCGGLRELPVAPRRKKWSSIHGRPRNTPRNSGRAARLEENRVQFAASPEQTLLKDAMDSFVRGHIGAGGRRTDRGQPRGYSADNWRSLAEIGVLGLPLAPAEGGLG